MNTAITSSIQSVLVQMTSGAQYSISKIFLHEENLLKEAQTLRASAAGNLGGISTGIGFLGSPEWALGGAFALGILEGMASNAAAKKAMSQIEKANQLMAEAKKAGLFISIKDIENITIPQPGTWKGVISEIVENPTAQQQPNSNWLYPAPTQSSVCFKKFYAHSGEPFISIVTLDEKIISIAWDKVESFSTTTNA